MGDPPSPKTSLSAAGAGRAQLDAGSGTKTWGHRRSGADTAHGGNNTLAFPTPRKRLSETSVGSTVTSTYHNWGGQPSVASQAGSIPPSPRQNKGAPTLKMESARAWITAPSLQGLKYLDSSSQKVVMTPRAAAYVGKLAQESYASRPTTATSEPTPPTAVAYGEPAEQITTEVLQEAKKIGGEVALPSKVEEVTGRPIPRVRRQPWIGPPYAAVHKPPYEPQTWEYGKVENLLDPTQHPKPFTSKEEHVIMNDLESLRGSEELRVNGRPHYHQYPHRAPAAGSYLEDYPVPPPQGGHTFEKDPLLRSFLTPHDNLPYIREHATYGGQPLNYMHNDLMLNNVMITTPAQKYSPGTVQAYADIPNFGRVQSVFMPQPDGTVYPLVTLPKMTPHDIYKVLNKMKNKSKGREMQRSWYRIFCCGAPDTVAT